MTGFSEQVNFQQVARITQNNDQVGTVKVTRDGKVGPLAGPLLLRGYTDDYYSGDNDTNRGAYQWSHAPDPATPWWQTMSGGEGGGWRPPGTDEDFPDGPIVQEVELSPTRHAGPLRPGRGGPGPH